MVRQGLARDCSRFNGGRCAEAKLQAAAEGATIGGIYSLAAAVIFARVATWWRHNTRNVAIDFD
jgi:hypothetical protein